MHIDLVQTMVLRMEVGVRGQQVALIHQLYLQILYTNFKSVVKTWQEIKVQQLQVIHIHWTQLHHLHQFFLLNQVHRQ